MAESSGDRLPDGYRPVRERELAGDDGPWPQLVWLWVYYQGNWSVTGSGVLIADDVILTCAHIFAFNGAPYTGVIAVSAFPGYNQPHHSDKEPPGGLRAETVYICGKAFAPGRTHQGADPAWDLAVVCLTNPVPPRKAPPFVVVVEDEIGRYPEFQGPGSKLMTAGYGGPPGKIVFAYMPIAEAYGELHWMGVTLPPSPGQSGAPMFHTSFAPGDNNQLEFRLVGVVSAEDRTDQSLTIGALITEETEAWINIALETHRKVMRSREPGQLPGKFFVVPR
jgi:hypothetical protein